MSRKALLLAFISCEKVAIVYAAQQSKRTYLYMSRRRALMKSTRGVLPSKSRNHVYFNDNIQCRGAFFLMSPMPAFTINNQSARNVLLHFLQNVKAIKALHHVCFCVWAGVALRWKRSRRKQRVKSSGVVGIDKAAWWWGWAATLRRRRGNNHR